MGEVATDSPLNRISNILEKGYNALVLLGIYKVGMVGMSLIIMSI